LRVRDSLGDCSASRLRAVGKLGSLGSPPATERPTKDSKAEWTD